MSADKPTEHKIVRLNALKPGKPTRIEHQGEGLLLCLVDNEVYAVHDTCTHEDISLSLGVLCKHRLRCPLHGSQFDIRNGNVLDEPADVDLKTYPVYVEEGWVCLKKEQ